MRFRSPPETPLLKNPPILRSQHSVKLSRFRTWLTRSCILVSDKSNLIRHANMNISLAVSESPKTSSYWTKAATFPKSLGLNSDPFTFTEPAAKPDYVEDLCDKTLSKDVLPAPLGPRIPSSSNGLRWPELVMTTYLYIFFRPNFVFLTSVVLGSPVSTIFGSSFLEEDMSDFDALTKYSMSFHSIKALFFSSIKSITFSTDVGMIGSCGGSSLYYIGCVWCEARPGTAENDGLFISTF